MPATSGASGPTTTKSIALRLAERDHRRMVGDVERDAFGLLGDAGIARRADQPVGQRARRHLPGQRVLAAAGAEEENVHAGASTSTRPKPAELVPSPAIHSVHTRLDGSAPGVVCWPP